MSFNMNRVTLAGNVGQDPEIRSTNGGNKVCNISLATNKSYVKDGEKHEITEWHRLVIFGDGLIDKLIAPYVSKGSSLFVEGELRTRKWQDQSGNDRYSTEIVLSGPQAIIRLLGDRKGKSDGGSYKSTGEHHDADVDLDDEIPF
jgi:single-strand DNA-binding protein